MRRARPPAVPVPGPSARWSIVPQTSDVCARLVCLPRSGDQSWEDSGVVCVAVHRSECVDLSVSKFAAVFARARDRGPALQFVAVVDRRGGELVLVDENVTGVP